MPQAGYVECDCCGRMYKDDGSEDQRYQYDHGVGYTSKDHAYDMAMDEIDGYCEMCEMKGHTFRTCPARDDE